MDQRDESLNGFDDITPGDGDSLSVACWLLTYRIGGRLRPRTYPADAAPHSAQPAGDSACDLTVLGVFGGHAENHA